jgi:hypothetical protein
MSKKGSIDLESEHGDAGRQHSRLYTDSMKRSQLVMITRRNLISQVALGAATVAVSSGLMSVPALAADGQDKAEQRQRQREQRRRDRRQDRKDHKQNQNN